jgi:iron-sulfur cluster assembly accessory protein
MIEVTDTAIQKLIDKKVGFIRLGVKGGGCAGYEYYIEDASDYINMSDKLVDYGKFNVVLDEMSVPYLSGSTLDWVKDGLNEYFKIINPKEVSSCGCGVSIQFNEDLVSQS